MEDSPFLVVRSSRLQMRVQPEPGVCQSEGRSVIGAVCATVGNRGHGVVSSSGNTKLQDDL